MGNRGILHVEQEIRSRWKTKAWVTCRLDMPGPGRRPFSPNTYTELFFLDEVTALAAGHRPCRYCRPERFLEFKQAWLAANSERLCLGGAPIGVVDRVLHMERVQSGNGQNVKAVRQLDELPAGTIVEHLDAPHLLWRGRLRRWSFEGYGRPATGHTGSDRVQVITPLSIVRLYKHGFAPQVHPSAYC
jgi:hypothetical protein